MIPLAKAANFKPTVHKWKTTERMKLMTELDAAFFVLYGIERDDVEYILSTFSGLKKQAQKTLYESDTVTQILKYYERFKENLY